MAQQEVFLGSVGPYLYEDADFHGLRTTGQIMVETAPVDPLEVVRLMDLPGIDAAATVEAETTFGISPAVGTDAEYARQDHTHGTPTNPVIAHEAASDPHTGYQKESEKDSASGYAGLNASSRITKGVDTSDDVIIDLAAKGLVLKDTAGTPHYWRVTVTTLGVLTVTDLGTTKP